MRPIALFINGIYRNVLDEIIQAQERDPELVCFLQPYSPKRIRLLHENRPTPRSAITLFASTSLKTELSTVSYTASIVRWEDKYNLPEDRRPEVAAHLRRWQPGEYEFADEIEQGVWESRNLISVTGMRKLENPFSVAELIKVSDGEPFSTNKTMAGGWSAVYRI